MTPELTVGLVRILLVSQIVLVNIGSENQVQQALDKLLIVRPRETLLVNILSQGGIIGYLSGETVVDKTGIGIQLVVRRHELVPADVDKPSLEIRHFRDEQKIIMIQVIRFLETEQEFVFSDFQVAVSVLIVGVYYLQNFNTD